MYFLPSIYAEAFSVGVTNLVGTIANNSSRGPVLLDGSNRIKPDLVSPYAARTSFPGGVYGGTGAYVSPAIPHVAGAIALLISARPALAGQVVAMEELLKQTAVPKTTSQNCGDVPGSEIPNNTYGWGLLDAYAAYVAAMEITSSPGNLPGTFHRLLPVEPNPFNPRTTIRFELASSQRVAIDIYDSRGALVAKVTEGICGPGAHAVTWNGDGLHGEALSSGIYLLRLVIGEEVLTQKLTLVR